MDSALNNILGWETEEQESPQFEENIEFNRMNKMRRKKRMTKKDGDQDARFLDYTKIDMVLSGYPFIFLQEWQNPEVLGKKSLKHYDENKRKFQNWRKAD
jgi:hypothetical protein